MEIGKSGGLFQNGKRGSAGFLYEIPTTYIATTLRTSIHVKGTNTGNCNLIDIGGFGF
jgi:hypothetical protein